MPQAAIGALAQFLWINTALGFAAATFIAQVFVYAASSYLLNRISSSLAARPRSNGLGSGTEINYYDSGAPIRIVYGRVRTGGMETIPPLLSGANNAFLHKILTLAGHEIDSYTHTHFDTTTITNASINAMAFTGSDGMVNTGPFNSHAWVRRYRGTSTDSADRMLMEVNSSGFNNARARGIAKVALTFKFNQEVYRSLPNTTFTYQGKRLYDPRLDVTPGASPTNASYIAWSANPALALVDYLMATYGGEYESIDIDWDTVVTAANYCDGVVDIPGSTQARYTCNGVIFAPDDFAENVKAIVDSMLGRVIFRDGKWRVFAGSWQTPTFTIQKSDWLEGGLSIRFEQGKVRRFNRMRCWFVDPDRDWQRVECLPRSNTTFKHDDGNEVMDAETQQLLCTNEYEAQRKAEFLLRQSRNQITVVGRLPARMQNIALWDTGTIVFDHLGWSSKTFRCAGCDMNPDGSMDVAFSEEQSGDWTDMVAADYNSPSTAQLPTTNVTTPSEPTSFAVTPNIDGTLGFEIGRPVVLPMGSRYQVIRSTNSANASVGTIAYDGSDQRFNLVAPASRHWYYARAYSSVNTGSFFSGYLPNTFGVLGEPRGFGSTQINSNAATDVRVSSNGASGGPVFLSGPNSQTTGTNTLQYVNSLSSNVQIQCEFSLLNASVSYDASPPTVARSAYVFATNSSGSGESNIVALYPDVLNVGAITPTAVLQLELLGGDTITVSMKHVLGHSNAAAMNWNSTIARLSAIKR